MTYLIVVWWHHMATQVWVSIGSGDGLLADGINTSHEPVSTYINKINAT